VAPWLRVKTVSSEKLRYLKNGSSYEKYPNTPASEVPDANETGHWVTKQASPGLYGVDKYGLMTDPVTCVSFGAVLSCPNRFSDREMVALGFTSFPPPAPDPCITQVLSLQSELNSLGVQIRSIEAQYPRGIPSSIYDSYVAMVNQYNSLVSRRNALPCDAS